MGSRVVKVNQATLNQFRAYITTQGGDTFELLFLNGTQASSINATIEGGQIIQAGLISAGTLEGETYFDEGYLSIYKRLYKEMMDGNKITIVLTQFVNGNEVDSTTYNDCTIQEEIVVPTVNIEEGTRMNWKFALAGRK